jgi:hypothetical protein
MNGNTTDKDIYKALESGGKITDATRSDSENDKFKRTWFPTSKSKAVDQEHHGG